MPSRCQNNQKEVRRTKGADRFVHIFFHPDYTVGPGVSPGQRARLKPETPGRGLYRQWGIAPRPEDIGFSCPKALYGGGGKIATPGGKFFEGDKLWIN